MTLLCGSLREALFWENQRMWLLLSGVPGATPAHNSCQHRHHQALTSQHLSSPTSPQAYFIRSPASSSLVSPGSYPTQSKTHPLSEVGVSELSGSWELIAEALEEVRVDNSLLSSPHPRNIYFLMGTILSQCFFTTWLKDSGNYQNSTLG